MKIVLKNFGCYSNKTFTFDNNFTLLNGPNGCGKSTIFNAICYALYGKNKTLKYGETSSTVQIINDDCKITRCSKPMRLTYVDSNNKYEGEKAQSMISSYYGLNWEQFNLCAWINSTTKASIATITPTERYNVIRTMVCNTEETLKDVEAISNEESRLESEYNAYDQERIMYEKMEDEYNDFEKPPEVDIPADIDNIVNELEEKIERLYRDNRGMNLDDIRRRISDIRRRPELVEMLEYYKTLLNYENKIQKREANIREFNTLRDKYFNDIQKSLEANTAKLSTIDPEILKTKMQEHTMRMIAKDRENPYWKENPDTIRELLQESSSEKVTAQMRSTVQKCPHCEKSVCINEDVVHVWNRKYASSKNYLSRNAVKFLEELSELQYPYSNVDNEYNNYNTLKNSITEYRKILDSKILSSELVRMNKGIGSNIKKPQNYKCIKIPDLQSKIEELYIQIGGIDEEDSEELEKLQARLESTPVDLDISTIKSELAKMRELQHVKKSQIQYSKISDKLQNIRIKLAECKKHIESINIARNSINILKMRQKEAEILSMQNILNTINTYSKKYLDMFFNIPINVHISMIRKTAKTTKMSLEMNCEYNGYKYPDITSFSQGELIKINLAFIFALNQLSNCKFLLLDEVMSNIDRDLIGEIYEVIKDISRETKIIVIDHNATIGSFDHVVVF